MPKRKVNVGLRLLVGNPESADAVLRIGWCLSEKTLETIQKHRIRNPHILIVVARAVPDYRYEEEVKVYSEYKRLLIPLKQGMEITDVNKAGSYRLLATIVGGSDTDVSDLRKTFFGAWKIKDLVTPTGELDIDEFRALQFASLDVEVGEEFFAHEPANWEKRWVNLFFRVSARDQCHFRKRRLLAYSLQPLLVAIWLIAITLFQILVGLLMFIGGFRQIKWKAILHPWREAKWIFSDFRLWDSVFFTDKTGEVRPYTVPAWPYFSITLVLIIAINAGYWDLLWFITEVTKGVITLLLSFSPMVYLLKKFGPALDKSIIQWLERRREDKMNEAANQPELAFLSCSTRSGADIANLPSVPIRLRFKQIKASVCRPYSK